MQFCHMAIPCFTWQTLWLSQLLGCCSFYYRNNYYTPLLWGILAWHKLQLCNIQRRNEGNKSIVLMTSFKASLNSPQPANVNLITNTDCVQRKWPKKKKTILVVYTGIPTYKTAITPTFSSMASPCALVKAMILLITSSKKKEREHISRVLDSSY